VTLVRSSRNEGYWPDFSTVVVRDGISEEEPGGGTPAALDEHEIDGGFGTAGRAGDCWFLVTAGDGPHQVTLEVHDAPPGLPGAEWPQVMETPYRSFAGCVGLSNMTDGPALDTVALLGGGSYRLQVCNRWSGLHGEWLLRWWPCSPEDPPRWLRRKTGPYEDEDSLAEDVLAVVAWSPGHTYDGDVRDLADRLMAPAPEVRAAIEHAVEQGWLERDGAALTVPGGAETPELEPPPL
jgi:hypothetical protein